MCQDGTTSPPCVVGSKAWFSHSVWLPVTVRLVGVLSRMMMVIVMIFNIYWLFLNFSCTQSALNEWPCNAQDKYTVFKCTPRSSHTEMMIQFKRPLVLARLLPSRISSFFSTFQSSCLHSISLLCDEHQAVPWAYKEEEDQARPSNAHVLGAEARKESRVP